MMITAPAMSVFALAVLLVLAPRPAGAGTRTDCFGPDTGRRIESCTQLLKTPLSPLSKSLAYAMRALSYSLLQRYPQAIADYDQALSINPDFANALNNRAWAYFKLGQPEKGAPDVERALRLSPRSQHAYDTRAHIHQAMGNTQAAITDYRRAMKFGGARIIRLYQCGLQANGLYDGALSGIDSGSLQAALETCVSDQNCDPLPADEECRKLTS